MEDTAEASGKSEYYVATALAKAVGRTRPAVYNWMHKGYRPAEGATRRMVARFTGGAVPEDSWTTAEEREALERVQPFQATGT